MASNLTFGIELEMLLIFHNSTLRKHLDSSPITTAWTIVPNTTGAYRAANTSNTSYANRSYQGWALHDPSAAPVPRPINLVSIPSGQPTIYRAYHDEPLVMARDVLEPQLGTIAVVPDPKTAATDYKTWTLSPEISIDCLDRSTANLGPDYDSSAVELISPVLSSTTTLRTSLAPALNLLTADRPSIGPTTSAMVNDQCGTHVHIGLHSSQPFPLRVLQHLALLVVLYESAIDTLLPIGRRSTANNPEIRSVRAAFATDGAEPLHRTLSAGTRTTHQAPLFDAPSTIRTRLFATSTPADLLKSLGGSDRSKGYLVNFNNTLNPTGTVEFRQWEGCLDVAELEAWVKFCLAMVKLAWKQADQADDEAVGGLTESYDGIDEWDDSRISLDWLWGEMELEDEVKEALGSKRDAAAERWLGWLPEPVWGEDEEDLDWCGCRQCGIPVPDEGF